MSDLKQWLCEHVGGLGPPFPNCAVCAAVAKERAAVVALCEDYARAQHRPGVVDTGDMWRATGADYIGKLVIQGYHERFKAKQETKECA